MDSRSKRKDVSCAVKSRKSIPSHLRGLILVALLITCVGFKVDADLYVSNLANRFDGGIGIGGIGIGDTLFPGQYYFLGSFTTGASFYSLNSAVLEFDSGGYGPNAWTNIDADLYQIIGNQPLPVVPLGRPTTNPTPTQWPQNTVFIDFHPNWQTSLQPFTQYQIALRVPIEKPRPAALFFSVAPNYVSLGGWQMGPTTRNGLSRGLFLKLAIDATILDPFSYTTNNEALTIVNYGGVGSIVSIPASAYGMPVVSIGQGVRESEYWGWLRLGS